MKNILTIITIFICGSTSAQTLLTDEIQHFERIEGTVYFYEIDGGIRYLSEQDDKRALVIQIQNNIMDTLLYIRDYIDMPISYLKIVEEKIFVIAEDQTIIYDTRSLSSQSFNTPNIHFGRIPLLTDNHFAYFDRVDTNNYIINLTSGEESFLRLSNAGNSYIEVSNTDLLSNSWGNLIHVNTISGSAKKLSSEFNPMVKVVNGTVYHVADDIIYEYNVQTRSEKEVMAIDPNTFVKLDVFEEHIFLITQDGETLNIQSLLDPEINLNYCCQSEEVNSIEVIIRHYDAPHRWHISILDTLFLFKENQAPTSLIDFNRFEIIYDSQQNEEIFISRDNLQATYNFQTETIDTISELGGFRPSFLHGIKKDDSWIVQYMKSLYEIDSSKEITRIIDAPPTSYGFHTSSYLKKVKNDLFLLSYDAVYRLENDRFQNINGFTPREYHYNGRNSALLSFGDKTLLIGTYQEMEGIFTLENGKITLYQAGIEPALITDDEKYMICTDIEYENETKVYRIDNQNTKVVLPDVIVKGDNAKYAINALDNKKMLIRTSEPWSSNDTVHVYHIENQTVDYIAEITKGYSHYIDQKRVNKGEYSDQALIYINTKTDVIDTFEIEDYQFSQIEATCNNERLFTAFSIDGLGLYKTDGTLIGTSMLYEIPKDLKSYKQITGLHTTDSEIQITLPYQDDTYERLIYNCENNSFRVVEQDEYVVVSQGKVADKTYAISIHNDSQYTRLGIIKDDQFEICGKLNTEIEYDLTKNYFSPEAYDCSTILDIELPDTGKLAILNTTDKGAILVRLNANGTWTQLAFFPDGFFNNYYSRRFSLSNETMEIEWHDDQLIFSAITPERGLQYYSIPYTTQNTEDSTNDACASLDIRIFPNPSSDHIQVNMNGHIGDHIKFYNNTGQELSIPRLGDRTHRYDISQLPTGAYLITTTIENQSCGAKFIKI